MRFGLLGPLGVWTAGDTPVTVPDLKVRVLLAALLAHQGHPASIDRLVEHVWADRPPANPTAALQTKVWQLRRALNAAEPGARDRVVSRPPGYLLRTGPNPTDAERFRALLEQTTVTALPRARAVLLDEALGLWRGPVLADFPEAPFATALAARLEEQRLTALEDRAEARLSLGEHHLLTGELADLLTGHPYRERLHALHLQALYRAGRQGEALDCYDQFRRRLADELGVDPAPELATLHRAILSHDPVLLAPAATNSSVTATPAPSGAGPPPGARGNLPVPLTELIGRESAIGNIHRLLDVGRLVTLVGSGGVGKTCLAVEAAHQVADAYPDGVWLVELASLGHADPATLAGTVLAVLGIREDVELAPAAPAEHLVAALQGRRLLLLLDNCEHVVEPVAELADRVLRRAPGVRLLSTSQEPLGVGGEQVCAVPPLTLPDPAVGDPMLLAQASAVRLFVSRATAAAPAFTLDESNARDVAELCHRLDGIPLALELAATRVRALGIRGLLTRIDDRFRVLTCGHRGAPPRQQTLRAMIDWSWELLSKPEQLVLRRLAAHADGCTLEAAEVVCADEDLPADQVLELLARLVDRSLVVMAETPVGPRHRLLESVAAYCSERLHEADEVATVRRRHRRYYTALARRADEELRGPNQRQWLARLDQETTNLRHALDDAISDGDAAGALDLTTALAWYGYLRGRLRETRRSIEAALAVPRSTRGTPQAAAACWHAGLALLENGSDHAPLVAPALAGWPAGKDLAARARAVAFLGLALLNTGDVAGSITLVEEVLPEFERLGDRWGMAAALSLRASQALAHGDLSAVHRDAEHAVSLFRELGDRWGQLQASFTLSNRAEATGDYSEAARLHREGLQMAEELGLWLEAADRLSGLGRIALLAGDYDQAREFHERALQLAAEQNCKPAELYAQIGLGLGARREGRLGDAEQLLRSVLDWTRQPGLDADVVRALLLAELGFIAELRGVVPAADNLHAESFALANAIGDPRAQALALEGLAGVAAIDYRPAHAARLLGAAAVARASAGAPLPAGERGDVDRITAAARAALGASAFDKEFDRGTGLRPEQAYGSAVTAANRPA